VTVTMAKTFRSDETVSQALVRGAAENPGRISLVSASGAVSELSRASLLYDALGILGSLQARGIGPGQEVVLQLTDLRDFLCAFWACLLGRVIAVPVSPAASVEQAERLRRIRLRLADSYWLRADRTSDAVDQDDPGWPRERVLNMEALRRAATKGAIASARPADIAYIQFSSGSTGDPKGVVLTHRNLIANVGDMLERLRTPAGSGHKYLGWLPLTHDLGMVGQHLTPLLGGLDHVLIEPELFLRRPHTWMRLMSEHRASCTGAPNFAYQMVLDHYQERLYKALDLRHVHYMLNAAEPVSYDTCLAFRETFARHGLPPGALTPGYGLAEAAVGVTCIAPGESWRALRMDRGKSALGDVVEPARSDEGAVTWVELGTPLPSCRVRVADERGGALPDRTIGEVQIKGDNVTSGYYRSAAVTRAAFTDDGWLATGDLGFVNGGSLVITGRKKDILFVNGQNFYAHDLERIASDTGIIKPRRIAVAGYHDEERGGDVIVAFIVSRSSAAQCASVAAACRDAIARSTGLVVRHFAAVSAIPRTTSGKPKRFALIEQYRQGVLAEIPLDLAARPRAPQQAARNEGEELLLRAVRAVLEREDVGIHDSFFAVGGDSIKAILLTAELKRLGWELDLKSVFQSSDFATAAALLRPSPGPQQPASDLAESGASAVSEEDLSLIREHVALLKSEPARRAT